MGARGLRTQVSDFIKREREGTAGAPTSLSAPPCPRGLPGVCACVSACERQPASAARGQGPLKLHNDAICQGQPAARAGRTPRLPWQPRGQHEPQKTQQANQVRRYPAEWSPFKWSGQGRGGGAPPGDAGQACAVGVWGTSSSQKSFPIKRSHKAFTRHAVCTLCSLC